MHRTTLAYCRFSMHVRIILLTAVSNPLFTCSIDNGETLHRITWEVTLYNLLLKYWLIRLVGGLEVFIRNTIVVAKGWHGVYFCNLWPVKYDVYIWHSYIFILLFVKAFTSTTIMNIAVFRKAYMESLIQVVILVRKR